MVARLSISDRGHEMTGVIRPGESWRAAAVRTTASHHAEPTPLDLSAEPKRFRQYSLSHL